MKKEYKCKGITLIEMAAVIVVLGLSIPMLLRMWADVAWRSARSEVIADATFYTQQLMEEIKSKGFDENSSPPWSTTLGPEGGEVYPNYNDVDDYNGYSDTPATNYTRSVVVDYVSLSGTTWQTSGSSTNFKRIRVTVSRTDGLVSGVTLATVVSGF